jgi:hypothetical protein
MIFNNTEFEEIIGLGGTARFFIDSSKNYFIKKSNYKELHENEIKMLKYLKSNNIEWCPSIIYSNDEFIVMNHCGEKITKDNLPKDYKNQANKIIDDMNRLKIHSPDIVCESIKNY